MLRAAIIATAAGLVIALPANAETKAYEVGSFSELDVSAGVTVVFEASEAQSITAENRNGNFEKLVLETRGDTLVVSRKNSGWLSGKRQNYTVNISAPAVSAIEVSSGASVSAAGISGDRVKLQTSSGSSLRAEGIQAKTIAVKASSGSDLDAYGTCSSADVSASSGASVDADGMECNEVDASASSGASVSAHASTKVIGSASSGASVKVVGGATEIEKSKSSGGSVTVS